MRYFWIAIGAAIILSGCATTPPPTMRYAKLGASQQDFMRDRYECIKQAQQPRTGAFVSGYGGSSVGTIVTSRPIFVSCMSAKGYTLDQAGPLVAPPGTVVYMVD
jgi:hypothetical protein